MLCLILQGEKVALFGSALTYLVVSIVAGVFGFGGIFASVAGTAQALSISFLALFLLSLIFHFVQRRQGSHEG